MSTTFDVAHIREHGVDLIIVFVTTSFGDKPGTEKDEICSSLQACATSAGLAGTVVPVWDRGDGRMGFYAPQQWHSFFSSISLADVAVNANRKLTCG